MNIKNKSALTWAERREPYRAQPEDARDEAATDYARIIHSASFRRLQGKTQILNLGDGDFYRNRLEDALSIGLMGSGDIEKLIPEEACGSFLTSLKARYKDEFENDVYAIVVKALVSDDERKHFINRMVGHFITSVTIATNEDFDSPLLRYKAVLPDAQVRFLGALKKAVMKVIKSASVQQLEFRGQNMVVKVFEALASDPKSLLPESTLLKWKNASDPMRVICDHVAGMTDHFLLKTYDRLFSPRAGSVFDRI
jgi:dGTPase